MTNSRQKFNKKIRIKSKRIFLLSFYFTFYQNFQNQYLAQKLNKRAKNLFLLELQKFFLFKILSELTKIRKKNLFVFKLKSKFLFNFIDFQINKR